AHIASADTAEVARWLERQVRFALHVPVLPGARLVGARFCVVGGHRGAVVEYEVGGVAVSYFVVPGGAGDARRAGPPRFDRTTLGDSHVVAG
ncbi:MAG: hypothetical protein WKG32_23625, partial [Gemmatimonadaceae bacterium]